ncbi:hypothetical protein [Yersinia enterocolitica]|nr:hypothetical protein [Yersinia enterocolitica]
MLDKSFPFPANSLEAKAERQLLEARAKAEAHSIKNYLQSQLSS